jgi:hypothetical protein
MVSFLDWMIGRGGGAGVENTTHGRVPHCKISPIGTHPRDLNKVPLHCRSEEGGRAALGGKEEPPVNALRLNMSAQVITGENQMKVGMIVAISLRALSDPLLKGGTQGSRFIYFIYFIYIFIYSVAGYCIDKLSDRSRDARGPCFFDELDTSDLQRPCGLCSDPNVPHPAVAALATTAALVPGDRAVITVKSGTLWVRVAREGEVRSRPLDKTPAMSGPASRDRSYSSSPPPPRHADLPVDPILQTLSLGGK